jgi:NAD(P)-dependent dehydrogenase (short-subunit alcohol dehydrogenase family)
MADKSDVRFAEGAAVVTGAGSGIGRATAVELAAWGRPVAVLDIDAAAGLHTVELCRRAGGDARAWQVDVADAQAVGDVVQRVATTWGGIGAVIPCAGIARIDKVGEVDRQTFALTMRVNLEGVVNVVEAAIPFLRDAGPGAAIAVVSSMDGVNGNPVVASYSMSKHALNGYMRVGALTLGPQGIRFNAVCPGPVATPMLASGERNGPEEVARHDALLEALPLGFVAQPEHIATVLRFLVSSDAAYINGAAIHADGGLSLT